MLDKLGEVTWFYLRFLVVALGISAAIVIPGLLSLALARHLGIA